MRAASFGKFALSALGGLIFLAQLAAQRLSVDYVNPLIGTAPVTDKEYPGNNSAPGEELYSGTVNPCAMGPDPNGYFVSARYPGSTALIACIGAVAQPTTAQGSQWVTLTTSSGYLSARAPRVDFGFGDSGTPAEVEFAGPQRR
jgi:ASPIC and UnbV